MHPQMLLNCSCDLYYRTKGYGYEIENNFLTLNDALTHIEELFLEQEVDHIELLVADYEFRDKDLISLFINLLDFISTVGCINSNMANFSYLTH